MSVHDDINAVQRCLDDLHRSLGRLEHQLGSGGLEIRRVRLDADHLRESMALLRDAAAASVAPRRPDLVTISDTPYDISLWTDSDDEGLGARDRRAP
jgi:regulator of replication initiation timing